MKKGGGGGKNGGGNRFWAEADVGGGVDAVDPTVAPAGLSPAAAAVEVVVGGEEPTAAAVDCAVVWGGGVVGCG